MTHVEHADRRPVRARPTRDTRFKVLWTLWMSAGGIAIALAVYALTDSVGWAFVALLASGVVLNALAQMVTQPFTSASAGTGGRAKPPHRANGGPTRR